MHVDTRGFTGRDLGCVPPLSLTGQESRPGVTLDYGVNRVTFTEILDDDTMMLKRFQFELFRVLRANPRGNGRKARAARET